MYLLCDNETVLSLIKYTATQVDTSREKSSKSYLLSFLYF